MMSWAARVALLLCVLAVFQVNGETEEVKHMKHLKEILAKKEHRTYDADADKQADVLDGDEKLTIEQMEYMEKQYEEASSRQKRKVVRYAKNPHMAWKFPVHYQFSGSHSSSTEKMIVSAMKDWEKQTCVRFKKVNKNTSASTQRINYIQGSGCYSYVGSFTKLNPQPLSIGYGCELPSIIQHELGHALGLWHEQQRIDRDDYLKILSKNIRAGYEGNFNKLTDAYATTHDLPYDYHSVMHYGKDAFASISGSVTMQTINKRYQNTIGQRAVMSFIDAKAINMAYNCTVRSCEKKLSKPCKHGGYQDPNSCNKCKCPDGLTGTYCTRVAKSSGDKCGGELSANGTIQYGFNPGYENRYNNYRDGQACTWRITAKKGESVLFNFVDEFDVYCYRSQCMFHWVEVNPSKSFDMPGYRYCCQNASAAIISDGDEMLVLFRSYYTYTTSYSRRGFKFSYQSITNPCGKDSCNKRGLCVPINSTDFNCECREGYKGDRCQVDINECKPNPCLNGGKCIDGENSYTCKCKKRTGGDRCELVVETYGKKPKKQAQYANDSKSIIIPNPNKPLKFSGGVEALNWYASKTGLLDVLFFSKTDKYEYMLLTKLTLNITETGAGKTKTKIDRNAFEGYYVGFYTHDAMVLPFKGKKCSSKKKSALIELKPKYVEPARYYEMTPVASEDYACRDYAFSIDVKLFPNQN